MTSKRPLRSCYPYLRHTLRYILSLCRVQAQWEPAWEGADNQAFVEQITGFTEELKSMADKLSVSSETLHKEKQNYVERMDGNIANVKKLAN